MKLSVIMGVYNSERTLEKSINSIIQQTYQDFKLIICNDGSIDNSGSIIKKYEKLYPNKILAINNEKNEGLTYSLNRCLEYVDTEYVARMDSDDISLPNRFAVEIDLLNKHPEYAFVGCAIERFDENGVWKKSSVIETPKEKDFFRSSCFVHPTIMIRTTAIKDVGGYTERWYTNRCEDYDLWMKLYAKGYRGYNLETVLFQYYEGKDSFPKRKYRYRICEAVMRAKGYASLGLYPSGIIFVFKPLIAGLLPSKVVRAIHIQK